MNTFTKFLIPMICVAAFSIPAFARKLQPTQLIQEPSFHEIVNAFLREEGMDTNEYQQWQKSIRRAPLFPTLYVGFDHQFKQSTSTSTADNVSISGGNITIGPQETNTDYDADLGNVIRLRAVWRLDQLIFNSDQFTLARERRDFSLTRTKLISELFKIFDQRSQALAAYRATQDQRKSGAYFAKYLSLTARLDQATGGIFHNRFWLGGSNASR